MRKSGFAFITVVVLVALTGAARAASFESAETCQPCHVDTYKSWSASLHALAYSNPIFTQAYRTAYYETEGKTKKLCLTCHAPTVTVTGDYDLALPVTGEGVTCDFCHSVTAVDLERGDHSFTLDPGKVKRSVLKDATTDAHETAYSADFASSKLCAGCHGMTSLQGVTISDTYSEWKASSFAKAGKVCQDCHMDHIDGKTAVEGGRKNIHDHGLSRNMGTMKEAVALSATVVSKSLGAVLVKLKVTNAKAGHAIPTGAVARKLMIEVATRDRNGVVIESQRLVYRKVVLDEAGNELTSDGEVFLYGAEVVSDNRLQADETRTENLYFRKGVEKVQRVTAEAFYLYEPIVPQQVTNRIPLSSATASVE